MHACARRVDLSQGKHVGRHAGLDQSQALFQREVFAVTLPAKTAGERRGPELIQRIEIAIRAPSHGAVHLRVHRLYQGHEGRIEHPIRLGLRRLDLRRFGLRLPGLRGLGLQGLDGLLRLALAGGGRGADHADVAAPVLRQQAVVADLGQRALEDRTQRLETLISNLPGMVYRCRNEPGWPMAFVGGECEELTGYDPSAIERGDVVWGEDVLHPDDRERTWDHVQDALETGDPFEVTYRIVTAAGETRWVWERGRAVTSPDGDRVLEGFVTDVTDQKERERTLEGLHETTRRVMQADDPHEVAEVVVGSVHDLLGVPFIGCWLHDAATNALVPVAFRDATGQLGGELPTYREGEGLSWRAFETGEVQVYDDVSTRDGRINPDTPVRSEMVLPLGDYGVLNVGSTEVGAFDASDVSLARVLAANTEAALERATRDA